MVPLPCKQRIPAATQPHAEAARSAWGAWKRSGTNISGGAGEESWGTSRVGGTRPRILCGSLPHSNSTKTSKGFWPCCLAVCKMLVSTAWARAPREVRLPPQFLRAPMRARMARSLTLFYKRRCQEKYFPAGPGRGKCSPRHRAPVAHGEAFWFCSGSRSHQLGSSREATRLPIPAVSSPGRDDAS